MTADAAGRRGAEGAGLEVLGARPLGPQDPAMVGRYRIHALLGIGGMGRVYLGWAQQPGFAPGRDGAWVAVKVIRPDLADNPEFRRRFARELEAVGRVATPYAAALVHGEPEAPQPWMATEFVPGVALADAVRPGEPLPAASVWRLAYDLGNALTAVHRAGIVHRDVKPSNVILGRGGAKIIDFGVAHASDLSQLTATGMNIGTPSYMAPEQAKAGEISPASDVFSLGVLLYFAASGRLPFGEGGTAEVLFRVVYEDPDVSGLDGIEPMLRDLILRCIAKTPLQRPNAAGIVALAENAASAGLWSAHESAVWPEGLAARISERTHAAGRTLPDPSLPPVAEPAAPPASVFLPAQPPPILPAADSIPTVYTARAADEDDVRRGSSRRHGVLIAGISTVAVLGLGAAAFAMWGHGTSGTPTATAATSSSSGTSAILPGTGEGASGAAGVSGASSASGSAAASSSAPTGARTSTTSAGGAATSAPAQQTTATKTSAAPAPSTSPGPTTPNKYTATQACGSGFTVIDHHQLTGATVYLLYNNSTGYNCVVTMATYVGGAVSMNATLAVENPSASATNPGTFTYYAGPVKEHAPGTCVKWGGRYKASSWTSGWTHCGT